MSKISIPPEEGTKRVGTILSAPILSTCTHPHMASATGADVSAGEKMCAGRGGDVLRSTSLTCWPVLCTHAAYCPAHVCTGHHRTPTWQSRDDSRDGKWPHGCSDVKQFVCAPSVATAQTSPSPGPARWSCSISACGLAVCSCSSSYPTHRRWLQSLALPLPALRMQVHLLRS